MNIAKIGLVALGFWLVLLPLTLPRVALSCGLYGRDCRYV